jgi:hypothetical protein
MQIRANEPQIFRPVLDYPPFLMIAASKPAERPLEDKFLSFNHLTGKTPRLQQSSGEYLPPPLVGGGATVFFPHQVPLRTFFSLIFHLPVQR